MSQGLGGGAAGGEATMSVLTEVDPDVAYPPTASEMSETWTHVRVRTQVLTALEHRFEGIPGCFVASDINVYYRPKPESAFVSPDALVSFGVDPDALRKAASYRLWDAGAPPAFVLEVASEYTSDRDMEDKPGIYLEMGVGEYWRFDPTGGDFYDSMLQGDRLAGGSWEPIPIQPDGRGLSGHSRVLGLDLHGEPGRLRFRDPKTGQWLRDYKEFESAFEKEAAARRAAEDRAETEAAARRAAEEEVTALRARLNDRNGHAAR